MRARRDKLRCLADHLPIFANRFTSGKVAQRQLVAGRNRMKHGHAQHRLSRSYGTGQHGDIVISRYAQRRNHGHRPPYGITSPHIGRVSDALR